MTKRTAKGHGVPTMTAQHFEYIVHILKELPNNQPKSGLWMALPDQNNAAGHTTIYELAEHFADHLEKTNEKFDRNLFMEVVKNG